ncbi:MAG: hypothetical protein ACHREM_01920 [Polyangiales bacterium]
MAFTLALSLAGCGAATTTTGGPKVPVRPLSAWAGEQAKLLDDGLDLGAIHVGEVSAVDVQDEDFTSMDRRVDVAEGAFKAKIVGINAEDNGAMVHYKLEVALQGEPLFGPKLDAPIVLVVEKRDPSYGTVHAAESVIVGQTIVVFFRRYEPETPGGEVTLHFHMTVPSARVLKEIVDEAQRRDVHGG